jgi:hypothetical protein
MQYSPQTPFLMFTQVNCIHNLYNTTCKPKTAHFSKWHKQEDTNSRKLHTSNSIFSNNHITIMNVTSKQRIVHK